MKKVFIIRRLRSQAPQKLSLMAGIRPAFRVDGRTIGAYNSALLTRILMVLVWLIEALFNRGILKAKDFENLPVINKLQGETVEIE